MIRTRSALNPVTVQARAICKRVLGIPRIHCFPLLALALLFCPHWASAAAVQKISWDSRAQYTRFIMEFDQYTKYNVIDSIKEKGYFYIDVYGMTTNYKRRLLNVNDTSLKYIDALSYPEHGVLRLVFYVKKPETGFKISRIAEPVRLVVDTLANSASKETPLDVAISREAPSGRSTTATASTPPTAVVTDASQSPSFLPPIPQPRLKPAATIKPGQKKFVIIDAGHGGPNNGAQSHSLINGRVVAEKDVTLQFAIQLKRLIDANPNMTAYLTRSDDSNVSLDERVKFAEKHTGDVFVSLHLNDGSGNDNARGVEFFYLNEKGTATGAERAIAERENQEFGISSPKTKGSTPLLRSILTDLERDKLVDWQYESYLICKKFHESFQDLAFFRQHDRGIKSDNFLVLKNFWMPAVLVEIGFITNSEDLRYLTNPQFQQATAALIYNGIVNYFTENDPNFRASTLNISALTGRR